MIVYIAGPMTGIAGYNRPAFTSAAERIEAMGDTPINPGLLPANLPSDRYMPICVAMIEAADAVLLLDGWRASVGATAESLYAQRQGKTLYDGLASYRRART